MSSVIALSNPIFVEPGEMSANTTIEYEKEPLEELWERLPGSGWAPVITGSGEKARRGARSIPVGLTPGQSYQICVYQEGHGRASGNAVALSCATVFCLLKKPTDQKLILEYGPEFGGTWSRHRISTKVATSIVLIGMSRVPMSLKDGIPVFNPEFVDGSPTAPMMGGTFHDIEINTLLPGNRYFFAVVVTDSLGDWEVRQESFTTFRRQVIVEFPTMHIYNDSDHKSRGDAQFWFQVIFGPPDNPSFVREFHLPEQDIDDWDQHLGGRPYSVGFAHVGSLEVVEPGRSEVSVNSWGLEDDGLEGSDGANIAPSTSSIPLPAGRKKESVSNQTFRAHCYPNDSDSNLQYGVDVRWSVTYAP
jgi:hypothetical protein